MTFLSRIQAHPKLVSELNTGNRAGQKGGRQMINSDKETMHSCQKY
jgi:hypothetical protein